MTRDGVEYTCDKCGKTMFAPTDMCSTMNSVRERMTRDWEEVTDDHGRKRDLCPECSKKSLAASSRKSNRRRASLLHYILYIVVRR